jgi:hypothetical protein
VLYLGVVNLARATLALSGSTFEKTLPLTMSLPYLAAGGIVWGSVFVAAAFGIWKLWARARRLLLIAIVVYQAHIWINHWFFDTSSYSRQVWPFQAGISVITTVVVGGFLFLPGIRGKFAKRET